jgi:hypothetical protein
MMDIISKRQNFQMVFCPKELAVNLNYKSNEILKRINVD